MLGHPFRCPRNYIILSINQLQICVKKSVKVRKQLEKAKQVFRIDSTLYEKKTLSLMEYEQAKNTYLQQLQAFESSKMGLDNQRMSILQLEQSIFNLEQQRIDQINILTIAITGTFEQLKTQIKTWELNFLLVAPCSGLATFTIYWQENQNVNAGQSVNVKLENYPYMEYGIIKVEIRNISLVPVQVDEETKAYILEVVFPKNLTTTHGKQLTFTQEMTGSAEIITEDLRLLDKFINPIKAVVRN